MNPTSKFDRDGVSVAVYDEPEAVTVGVGSYGLGHGMSLSIADDYFRELIDEDIQAELEIALDVALSRMYDRHGHGGGD